MNRKIFTFLLAMLMLSVFAIPVGATNSDGLTKEQQADYDAYKKAGYEVSISSKNGVLTINAYKKPSSDDISTFGPLSYPVHTSIYLGNYKVGTIDGEINAYVLGDGNPTITGYDLPVEPYPYGLVLCTFTDPEYDTSNGSDYTKLVQSFKGKVVQPKGGALYGSVFPVKMNYKLYSDGDLSISQS
ncbi:hypothetical protein LOK74_11485 [Brevibacillus humidisoli]|uniref:hypothetical protein n=1 Tax=Brevibacillus humidisoli TaxID=2895522 RepID=UPI001E5DD76D|nr:hypothetical protein [Brevibacillus humidisoli]UFJ43061.1 hypothetical protein LOK74_11485 [Brevibacillus humidisoli]